MILLYSTQITSRLTYISKFLFTNILGVPVNFTTDKKEFNNYNLPKINYSRESLDGITIFPHCLLFNKGIEEIQADVDSYQQIPVLFPDSSSPLPFDPFAAAFYMITRYEEYGDHPTDIHGRSMVTSSLANRHKFLSIPVVDHWAFMIKEKLAGKYPEYPFPKRHYKFIPTVDVDIAYAYRYRNFIRTLGAVLKSFFRKDWEDFRRRINTLVLKGEDPYNTFELLENWHTQHNLQPVYFFLLGKYGPYDKNINREHKSLHQLIRSINQQYQVGIHPSYRSNLKGGNLRKEIKLLSGIIEKPVRKSRQHFLMLRFPWTYQQLIKNGITDDYTMGYASKPGFRAGTCTPFKFYDLTIEKETPLTINPFQVMDGTLNQYMKLSPLEATQVINSLVDEVKKVNGTFISLWHNQSLSDIREWHRWREVYQQLLSYASDTSISEVRRS